MRSDLPPRVAVNSGVGSFGVCMDNLHKKGFYEPLKVNCYCKVHCALRSHTGLRVKITQCLPRKLTRSKLRGGGPTAEVVCSSQSRRGRSIPARPIFPNGILLTSSMIWDHDLAFHSCGFHPCCLLRCWCFPSFECRHTCRRGRPSMEFASVCNRCSKAQMRLQVSRASA